MLRFLALIVVLALMASCAAPVRSSAPTPAQTAAVRAALDADTAAATIRNRETEYIPAAQAVTDYVVALDAIDLSDAPPDFAAALRAHRNAWAALVDPLTQRATERAEMHVLFDRLTAPSDPLHEEFQRLIDHVWATWTPVEEAARRAGASP